MSKTIVAKELLRLLPEHRKKEKRTLQLTLDELIDDYRKLHTMSASELDFLLMAYRYEFPFQDFLAKFTDKKLKPIELTDLWRMAFASLLTRDEENIAQITHAWVEASKDFFGIFTSSLTNAFCRKLLREKKSILAECEKNPDYVLGPSLSQRWKNTPALKERYARKVLERPEAGISAMSPEGEFQVISSKDFKAGAHLAMSQASQKWVKKTFEEITQKMKGKSELHLLDACAAPGGKLIALLNLFQSHAKIKVESTAVDAKFKRIERLKENLHSWNLTQVKCVLHDWSSKREELGTFDMILADLPCTGLGTLVSRPDLLQRDWEGKDAELFQLQEKIISEVSALLKKDGLLFVSICSSDPSESQHLTKILGMAPSFQEELSQGQNSEEITGWVTLRK